MKVSTPQPEIKGKKVYVALSGGVDSAVAAALLQDEGADVRGVYMKNWSGEEYGLEGECPWKEDQKSAEAVCDSLGIPFQTYNFEKEYRDSIISYFFREYRSGRTPNPDILCNTTIKFGQFLERAEHEGADMIATGHYAAIRRHEDASCDLLRAADPNKDQTYFLHRLNQKQLEKSLFPLAHLRKPEVREIAEQHHLPNAQKKDSQGICFLGKIDVSSFLKTEIKPKIGPIVDIDSGKTVGEHHGVFFYTLGQREKIGIGGAHEPYFVAKRDIISNTLYVAKGRHNPKLFITTVTLENIHAIHNPIPDNTHIHCQLRYRQEPIGCTVSGNMITLDNPTWITSPGQSAVFMQDDVILGGGVIASVEAVSG